MKQELERLMNVYGFEFENKTDGLVYSNEHRKKIGEEGVVVCVSKTCFTVAFNGLGSGRIELLYPLSQWEKALEKVSKKVTYTSNENTQSQHEGIQPLPKNIESDLLYFKKALHFVDISFTNDKVYKKVYEIAKLINEKGGEVGIKELI